MHTNISKMSSKMMLQHKNNLPQKEAELLYTEGVRTLEQAAQIMESPSLEVFKNHLGFSCAICSRWPHLGREVRLGKLRKCPKTGGCLLGEVVRTDQASTSPLAPWLRLVWCFLPEWCTGSQVRISDHLLDLRITWSRRSTLNLQAVWGVAGMEERWKQFSLAETTSPGQKLTVPSREPLQIKRLPACAEQEEKLHLPTHILAGSESACLGMWHRQAFQDAGVLSTTALRKAYSREHIPPKSRCMVLLEFMGKF